MFAFASLNLRFSGMLAGLLVAGFLLAAAVATWLTASGPALRATGPAPPTRADTALAAARAVSLQTPPLTGPFPVATISLHLVDRSRRDPSSPSGVRELMVQFWYPAQATQGHAVAPYMPAQVAQLAERYYRIPDHLIERLRTRAYTAVPITPGHHAVLLYSPGLGEMRSDDTALEENLASDGFVVVAIDHTHEAQWVQFPDGRIVPWSVPYTSSSPYGSTPAVALRRVEDLQFVAAELPKLDRGNPVVRGALDLGRVGAFGFSLGGSTAANAMKTDPQIRAGANLDGAIQPPVLGTGLSRPFMLMLDPGAFAYFRPFVRRLTGPYLVLQLDGSRHAAFTDDVWLSVLLRRVAPRVTTGAGPGSVNAAAAVGAESAYLDAFFETYLDARRSSLLTGQSKTHPVVKVLARRG
jgi:dienelactone hydrolase